MAPVPIRPTRSSARAAVVPISFGGYFERGGFEVGADSVHLRSRFGRETIVPMADVAEVVLAELPRFDSRVLLLDAHGRVLGQDQATFYSDADLQKLASAVGVPFRQERLMEFSEIERIHPDLFRYGWMYHPMRAAAVLTVSTVVVLLVVLALADALR